MLLVMLFENNRMGANYLSVAYFSTVSLLNVHTFQPYPNRGVGEPKDTVFRQVMGSKSSRMRRHTFSFYCLSSLVEHCFAPGRIL